MKRRIQTTIIALAAIVGNATGQTLNVEPIEDEAGAQASLQVSLTAGTGMTALQFNLHLPEGITLDEAAITQGEATNSHELLIRPLEGGDHLFILSSKRLNTFKDGELLRIPLNIGDDAETGDGRLHVVRMATTDAVSIACEDATFEIVITAPEPKPEVTDEQYEAAQGAIAYEVKFTISTDYEGTEYFLTQEGYLTTSESEAGVFIFHRTEGSNLFRSPGWKLDECFSNPKLTNGSTGELKPQGHILTDTDNNRQSWEGQVWYLGDEGLYAVRATNAASDEWGAQTYWTVLDTDQDGQPEADYSWTPDFRWKLAKWIDTGVEGIMNEETSIKNSGAVYDLSGRRIAEPAKGVYIRDRRKVVVK